MTTTIETQKCKCCGRELPVSKFTKTNLGILKTCKECIGKKHAAAHVKKRLEAEQQTSIEEARRLRLKDFSPRELLAELKSRGYKWDKMWVEQVQYVDFNKI
jgi:hypothetical protein